MNNETEQLRRLVDAREKATKGKWMKSEVDYSVFGGDGFHVCDPAEGPHISKNWNDDIHTDGIPYRHWADAPGEDYIDRDCDALEANQSFIALAGSTDLRAILLRMEKMEAALEWYADDGNWQKDPNDAEVLYERNAGGIAREALE